jgi:hypothetical protein
MFWAIFYMISLVDIFGFSSSKEESNMGWGLGGEIGKRLGCFCFGVVITEASSFEAIK